MRLQETYLGEAVHASFDGRHVWLRRPRDGGGNHEIALEPRVVSALLKYVREIRRRPIAEPNRLPPPPPRSMTKRRDR